MIMIRWRVLLFVGIFLVVQQSDASFVEYFRNLGQADQSKAKSVQMSPSPTPVPWPADPPKVATLVEETCDKDSYKCRDYISNMTACLASAPNGFKGSILLVRNDGEINLKLKVTVLPKNFTFDIIEIPRHQIKKIDMAAYIGGSSSIILNAGNGECVINIGVLAPLGKMFSGYATPINGAYLLFGTVVIIGGAWACCMLRKKGRHLDGVPYQELEMEQQHQQHQQQSLPYVDTDNWDQSWDDDWDEEKAVRSPGGSRVRSRMNDGVNSRSMDSDEWGSDWND